MSVDDTHSFGSVVCWGGGVTGGLVGGVAMGLVLHLGGNQIELLGGLAPVPGVDIGVGWTIHLMISVLFGLAFAVLASRPSIQQRARTFTDYVITGLLFGTLIGLFAGGVLFPTAMERVGVASLPPAYIPVDGMSAELFSALLFAVGHLVYGVVLGGVYAVVVGTAPEGVRSRIAALGR